MNVSAGKREFYIFEVYTAFLSAQGTDIWNRPTQASLGTRNILIASRSSSGEKEQGK